MIKYNLVIYLKKILFLIPLLFITTSCKSKSSNVLDYELKSDNSYRVSLSETSKTKSITIPKTYNNKEVTEISGFRNNNYVEKVSFSKNITKVDEGTFSFCAKLKNITVTDNEYYSSKNGVLYQDDYILCYPSGKLDKELIIHENIKSKAFSLCPSLEKVTIHSKIVEENAFYYLENLSEVIITDNVEKVEDNFFYGNEIDKIIIKNKDITGSININYAKEIYAIEYVALSLETQKHYIKTNVEKIDDVVYEVYSLK